MAQNYADIHILDSALIINMSSLELIYDLNIIIHIIMTSGLLR